MEVVRGHLQAYDWGPVDGLAAWTPATGGPQAELWFGSHPNGPSPLRAGGGTALGNMPILTKVLAAAKPLSIQIHPPAEVARAQFDAQQADPALPRLLSDPYAKAEILIALEPFLILEGLREPSRSAGIFARLGDPVNEVAGLLAAGDLRSSVRRLLAMPADDVAALSGRLPEAFTSAGMPGHDAAVIAEVVQEFPGDPGVFVAALLNARTLEPGEAVFVDPGTVHAYVRGTGLEVMTNSDNVLRLGLTAKTVAVDAALDALVMDAQPHNCSPQESDGIRTYAPPGAPFRVSLVRDARLRAADGAARTVVCLQGTADCGGVGLAAGEAVLLQAADPTLAVDVRGLAAVARHVA